MDRPFTKSEIKPGTHNAKYRLRITAQSSL